MPHDRNLHSAGTEPALIVRHFGTCMRSWTVLALTLLLSIGCQAEPDKGGTKLPPVEILNVSHDPTRELYQEINAAFAAEYEKEHGRVVTVKQSHAASGSQARAIVDGLAADVATL